MRKKKEKKIDRHFELSSKFMEMGYALLKEGKEANDFSITQSGSFMTLLAGLILDENDIYQFGELCSMFSAKKILDSMDENKNDVVKKLKPMSDNESYEDFIERINKIRRNNGLGPMEA